MSGLWPTSAGNGSSDVKSVLSYLGRTAYQSFSKVVVLTQITCEVGQDPKQVRFSSSD